VNRVAAVPETETGRRTFDNEAGRGHARAGQKEEQTAPHPGRHGIVTGRPDRDRALQTPSPRPSSFPCNATVVVPLHVHLQLLCASTTGCRPSPRQRLCALRRGLRPQVARHAVPLLRDTGLAGPRTARGCGAGRQTGGCLALGAEGSARSLSVSELPAFRRAALVSIRPGGSPYFIYRPPPPDCCTARRISLAQH
jgi:hypothetical protein